MSEQNDCIFCMIVEGKLPSSKVYETENLYAFLDLNPVHEGHTLIIPKKHCPRSTAKTSLTLILPLARTSSKPCSA